MAATMSLHQHATEWVLQNLQLSKARVKDCLGVNDTGLLLCQDLKTSKELGMRSQTILNAVRHTLPETRGKTMKDLIQRSRYGQHHHKNGALTNAAETRLLVIKHPTQPCRFEDQPQDERQQMEAQEEPVPVNNELVYEIDQQPIRPPLHHPRF